MIDPKIIDDFSRKIADAIPPGVKSIKNEVEKNVRATIESLFSKMNLISRDEFDIQSAVLARTREKLEALEKQIEILEKKHVSK